jgi:hypothetical protein
MKKPICIKMDDSLIDEAKECAQYERENFSLYVCKSVVKRNRLLKREQRKFTKGGEQ